MPHFPESQPAAHSVMLPYRATLLAPSRNEAEERRTLRLRIQTRRRRYLDLHPEYLSATDLELADPLLYDRLIRRFQSASEREREGRARGVAGGLEASLVRSEAKVIAVNHPDAENPLVYERTGGGEIVGLEEDVAERVGTREEGLERWKDVMERRFMRGEDGDFDYKAVDESQEFDDTDEDTRTAQEEYFREEDEEFMGDGSPQNQTGIQDF